MGTWREELQDPDQAEPQQQPGADIVGPDLGKEPVRKPDDSLPEQPDDETPSESSGSYEPGAP